MPLQNSIARLPPKIRGGDEAGSNNKQILIFWLTI